MVRRICSALSSSVVRNVKDGERAEQEMLYLIKEKRKDKSLFNIFSSKTFL
uniref:Uncharacterized protein n=1 Tax=Meloidogyne enterolobii TaxID=390850 RepID=A0A6V7UKN2_MELEN|nr:unnamed protein product [Meloidogyne enterolobii]